MRTEVTLWLYLISGVLAARFSLYLVYLSSCYLSISITLGLAVTGAVHAFQARCRVVRVQIYRIVT